MDAKTLTAAMAVAATGVPMHDRKHRPYLTRNELKSLRRSGNRTAPGSVQDKLIEKARHKRAMRKYRNTKVEKDAKYHRDRAEWFASLNASPRAVDALENQ
jgi:hypothetical protein